MDEKQQIHEFKSGLTRAIETRGATVTWDGDCRVNDTRVPVTIAALRDNVGIRSIRREPRARVDPPGIQVTIDRFARGMRPLFWRTRKAGWDFDSIAATFIAQAEMRAERSRKASAAAEAVDAVRTSPRWERLQELVSDLELAKLSLTGDGRISFSIAGLSLDSAEQVVTKLREIKYIDDPDARVSALALGGKAIEAIKLHRALYGSSLWEAKQVIDRIRGLA